MGLRGLVIRSLPEPPEKIPGRQELLNEAINLPLFTPFRLFINAFLQMRPWWPILVPLLLWVGWRTYHQERERVLLGN